MATLTLIQDDKVHMAKLGTSAAWVRLHSSLQLLKAVACIQCCHTSIHDMQIFKVNHTTVVAPDLDS